MSTSFKKKRTSENPEESSKKRAKIAPNSSSSDQISSPAQKLDGSKSSSGPQTKTKFAVAERKKHGTEPSEKIDRAEKRVKINKLALPKPFPTVAASASATCPRSAHKEGKNQICLTRKTSLGAYMRRCKGLIVDDGFKILQLHAAGAAIPLLVQLSSALPPILPFSREEIHTDISTRTVEVQDEVNPSDEDEDITYRTRAKSTLNVTIRVGDSESEEDGTEPVATRDSKPKVPKQTSGKNAVLVFEEPEQEQEDI